MIKIYQPGGSRNWGAYANWIEDRKFVDSVEEADVVMFCGGTDVESIHYGENPHPRAEYPDRKRDQFEIAEYKKAIEKGLPIISICRGSQLTCVMAGGKLVQHQGSQPSYHLMKTSDGEEVITSSTHHQAQYPFNMKEGEDYKLLAWTEGLSDFHLNGEGQELNPEKEAEVVFYPKINALGIQGHPEYMSDPKELKYFRELFQKLINKNL